MSKKRTLTSQSSAHGIRLKKEYGQHFLRDVSVVMDMIEAVKINDQTSIFEIGPGDGFLTNMILQTPASTLWAFEIDEQWVDYLRSTFSDPRLTIYHQNFLDVDFDLFEEKKPWTVLANLPYQVTFPILHRFQQHRELLTEGVVMVQEEVAQKIVKAKGRGYGFISLFFQWYFEWKLLTKIPPSAFQPPPKVDSRLLYFKPKQQLPRIPEEHAFWEFIRSCFAQPRRTLRNNLKNTDYESSRLSEDMLNLRAQQMDMDTFLMIWNELR